MTEIIISIEEKLDQQLEKVRDEFRERFMLEKDQHREINQINEKSPGKDKSRYRILVASDSMMNQIDETRLSKKGDVKVFCWGGCSIPQMREKIESLLEKDYYDFVILHVGTNDSTRRSSEDMLVEMIQLKQFVETMYGSKVIVSNIIERTDDGKANLTIKRFNEKLARLNIPIMDNANITSKYLGKKGHHLTSPYGCGRLAKNLISLIRKL